MVVPLASLSSVFAGKVRSVYGLPAIAYLEVLWERPHHGGQRIGVGFGSRFLHTKADVGPDALSRLAQPGACKTFPPYLNGVTPSCPPTRGAGYYLAGVAFEVSVDSHLA